MAAPLFILVDDDPTNNLISKLTISNTISDADIETFTDPVAALHFLAYELDSHPATSVILLLNLNMPFMSGWEFLKQFEDQKIESHRRISIYILSSSVNPMDRKKAEAIAGVKGFLTKPLSSEIVRGL